MAVEKAEVLKALHRIKGPDLKGNIVDLGMVSEILIKDERVYFSITVPAARAEELEDLRKAAEKVVADVPGVAGVTAVLTAEATPGAARPGPRAVPAHSADVTDIKEHKRVQDARAKGATGDGAGPRQAAVQAGAPAKPAIQGVPGVKQIGRAHV